LAVGSWLWSLEHSHLRVYLALTSLAAPEPIVVRVPVWGEVSLRRGDVLTTLDRLAGAAKVTKAVVRSALKALAAGPQRDGRDPAIVVDPRLRGFTIIAVCSTASSTGSSTADSTAAAAGTASNVEQMPAPANLEEHSKQHRVQHSEQHSAASDSTANSTGNRTATTTEMTSSRIELPVSSDVGQHSEQHRQSHSHPPGDGSGTQPALFSDPDQVPGDSGSPEIYRTIVGDSEADTYILPSPESLSAEETPETRTKASRISPQAWKAADYLRAKILDENPEAAIGKRPWSAHKQTGLRLAWAEEFRTMKERDGRRFEDAKTLMDWLFGGQLSEFKYVVHSPSALRAKWDRIVLARKKEAAPKTAPPKPSSVMPRKTEAL
jgi:hypothetical protein